MVLDKADALKHCLELILGAEVSIPLIQQYYSVPDAHLPLQDKIGEFLPKESFVTAISVLDSAEYMVEEAISNGNLKIESI